MTLSTEETECIDRLRRFLDTRDISLVSEDDIDFLAEHWKLEVRLHRLVLEHPELAKR